jgi:hypothetical protein
MLVLTSLRLQGRAEHLIRQAGGLSQATNLDSWPALELAQALTASLVEPRTRDASR